MQNSLCYRHGPALLQHIASDPSTIYQQHVLRVDRDATEWIKDLRQQDQVNSEGEQLA